jgi:hypothetical protein
MPRWHAGGNRLRSGRIAFANIGSLVIKKTQEGSGKRKVGPLFWGYRWSCSLFAYSLVLRYGEMVVL